MRNIVSTKDVLMGAPRIEGTRISVYDIVSSLWHDRDIEQYSNDFEITQEEIKDAIVYCKNLKCQKNNVTKFCNGCILNSINEKEIIYNQIYDDLFVNQGDNFFIAESISDLENEEFGFAGWYRAECIYNDLFGRFI